MIKPISLLARNFADDTLLTPEIIIIIPLVTAFCGAFIGSLLSEKWHYDKIRKSKSDLDIEKEAHRIILNGEIERRIISETKYTLLKRERDDFKKVPVSISQSRCEFLRSSRSLFRRVYFVSLIILLSISPLRII